MNDEILKQMNESLNNIASVLAGSSEKGPLDTLAMGVGFHNVPKTIAHSLTQSADEGTVAYSLKHIAITGDRIAHTLESIAGSLEQIAFGARLTHFDSDCAESAPEKIAAQ